ncbi:MAG TPA: FG-GAP-like repeat-containing protein [Candidatus Manganitrophaceae bacterium]|nr:FG-GAP-like repeat-containing protein [Candidatus Manganitrophaceae bacterium]
MTVNLKIGLIPIVMMFVLIGCGGGKEGQTVSLQVGQIKITPDSGSVAVGETQQFSAKVYDSGGNPMNAGAIGWASTNSTVAGVSAAGLVTAGAPGETVITASSQNVVSNPVLLKVTPGPIASIEVSPLKAAVGQGGTFQFTATAKDSLGNQLNEIAGSPITFIWKTDNMTQVTIDDGGKATGVAAGSAQITASTSDGKVISNPASLEVGSCPVANVPASIEISPSKATVPGGGSHAVQFAAVSKNTDGVIICNDPNNPFAWTVSTSIATIDQTGLATTGTAFGTTLVTATQGNVSATATLIVEFFHPPVQYSTGAGPQSVAIADYNLDGLLDLATANLDGRDVSILLNKPAQPGVFNLPISTGTIASGLFSLTTGQFNNIVSSDIYPDLAVVDISGGALFSLLNNGDGTMGVFEKVPLAGGPLFIASVDLNEDGQTDLLTANIANNTLTFFIGDGAGRFQSSPSFPPLGSGGNGPLLVSIDYFNGDSHRDLAVVNSGSDNVSVFLGDGKGRFTIALIPVGKQPVSIISGKFNQDAIRDIAVVSQGDATLQILLGNGDGTFFAGSPIQVVNPNGVLLTSITASDFNFDGLDDLAVTDGFNAQLIILINNLGNPGSFGEAERFFVGNNPQQVLSAGLRSNVPDLVVVNSGSNNVSILRHTQ